MATCKSCGARIVFIRSEKNQKWIPCDDRLIEYKAGEDPDYEDYVVDEQGRMIRCTFDFQCDPDGLARLPHWATCQYADRHRRK